MNTTAIKINSNSQLKTFIEYDSPRPFILVVPGGGYSHFGAKEQDSVALAFNKMGFNCAVLYYTLSPMKFPQPLADIAQAVALIKSEERFFAARNKIAVLGFSAGGHLSGLLGCYWNNQKLIDFMNREIAVENQKQSQNQACPQLTPALIKPDALCLCYPVISADKTICHEGSILALTENLSSEEQKLFCEITESDDVRSIVSLEKHVTGNFPSVFIWHTREDTAVPVQNTIRMAEALSAIPDNKVNFEYHLFAKGPHGLALAEDTCAACWKDLFKSWFECL